LLLTRIFLYDKFKLMVVERLEDDQKGCILVGDKT